MKLPRIIPEPPVDLGRGRLIMQQISCTCTLKSSYNVYIFPRFCACGPLSMHKENTHGPGRNLPELIEVT